MLATRRMVLGATAAGVALLAGCARGGQAGQQLSATLDTLVTNMLRESPEYATSLAVSEERAGGRFIDRLSDASKEGAARLKGVLETGLRELRAIDRARLSPQEQVSRDVVVTALEDDIAARNFTTGDGASSPYAVSQLEGAYTDIPDFLDSQHPITSRDTVEAYLARLSAYARVLGQENANIAADAGAGVAPPDFAVDGAIRQLGDFARLRPADTVLVASLARRIVDVAEIPEADRAGYLTRAETIVREEVLPQYAAQIEALRAVRPQAVHDAGCWRLPQGGDLYTAALRYNTTTSMTPEEIHRMGTDLIASMTAEMDQILRAQGQTRGTVGARMRALAQRPEQLYPNTDAGRTQLLADLNAQIAAINARMPEYFGKLARAALEIKRVPPYIEAGAPGGYYQSPALDGSRAGAYYINLRDTSEWPRFTLPTLTYHEGIPGHHWQIAIAQETEGLPFIRSAILGFNAYQEGWGLYAEQLADEAGVYADDPFGRLGYLQSAVFRASRLVVDTGMHHMRWSREQAIQSMMEATGDQQSSVATEIERYAVWPGQACGYMVGRQAIHRLREEARAAMGARFDIKAFHDLVLTSAPVPLSVLESLVRDWTGAPARG
jgi:uncharacterized protein (DUF885 family)